MEWGASEPELAQRILGWLPPATKRQLSRPIHVCGQPLDLCKLYREVQRRGGVDDVSSRDQWDAVAESLGLPDEVNQMRRLSRRITLSTTYKRFLYDMERHDSAYEEDHHASQGRGSGRGGGGRRAMAGGDRLVQAQEAARLLASVPASGGGSSSLADEVRALNTLTRLTESGDFELLLDYVPDLLDAIAASMDRHNAMIQPFRQRLVKQLGSGRRGSSLAAAVLSSKREQGPPLVAAGLFSSHVQPAPSTIEGQLVCGNAILLQNLSFIMGNQEAIAYHPRLLAHLASLLPLWHPSTDLGLYACTALANLSKYLDVNGMPMTVAVEDSYDAGGVPEDSLMALAPPKMRTQAATGTGGGRDPDSLDFIAIVYNIFPTLFDLLTTQDSGSCLYRCLDCLCKLMLANEDNGEVVARYVPASLLTRLHEFLYVPGSGLDALPRPELQAKASSKKTPRFGFEDWAKACDSAMLDLSLEVLVALSAFQETHAKLQAVPGLLRTLVGMFGMAFRGDTLPRAAMLVRVLTGEEKGQREMETLKPMLLHWACRSEAAATLLWSLFVVPPIEEEQEEDVAEN